MAAKIGKIAVIVNVSVPGRTINSTPIRPTRIATHLQIPTTSPRNTTEKIVIKKGATKNIDTTVANGKSAKAVKKNKLAAITNKALRRCNFIRLVRNNPNPPASGTTTVTNRKQETIERVNTI